MRLYTYNEENLSYNRIPQNQKLIFILGIFSICLLSFFVGAMMGTSKTTKKFENNPELASNKFAMSKHDMNPEQLAAWKDSVFKDYAIRADLYLSRPKFQGTPLKGEMMALCARNAYDSTGVLLPVELALSQAQWESSMGREGKSPKNNPFNIGENDSGTVQWFNSTFGGTQAYYYYMCRNYLSCRTIDQLFGNFVNCNGHRYASSPTYEEHIRNQYYAIQKWINNAIDK